MKFKSLIQLLTAIALNTLFTGCFFDNQVPFILPEETLPAEESEVRLNGFIGVSGLNSSSQRSAIAAMPSTIEYFVTAQTPEDTPGGKLTVDVPNSDINTTQRTFSINLKTGYYWTITVGIKDKTKSDYPNGPNCIILKDSYSKTITATDTSIEHSFLLQPVMSNSGTGSIELYINLPSAVSLSITDEDNLYSEWDGHLTTISTTQKRLYISSISSGIYVTKLKFQESGRKPYIATQVIAVYDNMTTDTWVSGGNALITGSTFELTSTIYNASVNGQRNFYVDATATNGDTQGTGESLSPFKTVARAISMIYAIGDGTSTYKVYAKAGGSETTSTRFVLTNNIDVVVYEDGEGKGPANPSGTYTVNFSGTSTLFTAKKSFSITGLNLVGPDNTEDSSGVGLDSATSIFTLNSGEISKFRCGVWGGGYTDGYSTINLYGGKIFDNGLNTDTNTSGNAGCGLEINTSSGGQPVHLNVKGAPIVTGNKNAGKDVNINLISSSDMITVVGALTTGCDLGVSSNYISGAGNANARQITQGYQAKNGSDAPSSYFHGDKYAIGRISTTSEVYLGQSGGSYSVLDLESVKISRTESAPIASKLYSSNLNMEFKIMNGENALNKALSLIDIKGYGSSFLNEAFYSTRTRTGGGIKVTLNGKALPAGFYNVIVGLTHEGAKYDFNQKIQVIPEVDTTPSATIPVAGITGSFVLKENRSLTIKPLIASTHEVTQEEYSRYMTWYGVYGNLVTYRPLEQYGEGPDYPAYFVSWYDAVIYCNLLSKAEGLKEVYYLADSSGNEVTNGREISTWKNTEGAIRSVVVAGTGNQKYCYFSTSASSYLDYSDSGSGDSNGGIRMDTSANGWRLPTEAEWEYLARGGNLTGTQTDYSGSNTIGNVAWYNGNSGDNGTGGTNAKSHVVCTKDPNTLGLYDMSGNIWEWCWDWYTTDSNITVTTGASGPVSGNTRVFRGGGWDNISDYCKVNYRSQLGPGGLLASIGFRVVRNAQ